MTLNSKGDYVFEKLKQELQSKGLSIQSVDHENNCYIQVGGLNLKINLEQTQRDFERDGNKSVISNLVDTILAYDITVHEAWEDVKDRIYTSFCSSDFDTENAIFRNVTSHFKKAYVYMTDAKRSLVSAEDIAAWGVTEEQLESVANENAGSILKEDSLIYDDIDGHKLWRIDIEKTWLRASVLLSNQLKELVKEKTGVPFYAVLPERDSCYFFSKTDFNFFAEKLALLVTEKYQDSAYPITTELLEITDSEVKVAGKYKTID